MLVIDMTSGQPGRTRDIAAGGELVRAAGVMEQPSALAQHPRQLLVERQRIQLTGNAEARRVMQDGVETGIGQCRNFQRHVRMRQPQTTEMIFMSLS